MSGLREILRRPGFRYLIVGGSVYGLEIIVIVLAQHLGATPTEAVTISFLTGLIVSFFLQKLFTFSDKRMHHKIIVPQAAAVTLLVIFNLSFTIVITRLLQEYWPPVVTRTLALGMTTVWNFYLYKTRIFSSHPTDNHTVINM